MASSHISHSLSRKYACSAFSKEYEPVLRIDEGAIITFETDDTLYERLSQGETIEQIGWDKVNPVTGPVFVNGARPGDALCIEILDIEITRSWVVWETDEAATGVLHSRTEKDNVYEAPIRDGKVYVSERMGLPLEPMIGAIGVAPAEGRSSTFEPTYPWGGNMDLKELKKGTKIWLPVHIEGGLLFIGDLHASMGAGEPVWLGLESAGKATVLVTIDRGQVPTVQFPRLRVGSETLFMGIATKEEGHFQAQQRALNDVYDYLTECCKLTPTEAFAYCCAKVDARFGGPANVLALLAVPDPDIYIDASAGTSHSESINL